MEGEWDSFLSHRKRGNDFTNVGARREIPLNGISLQNKTANRRLPFNTELL